MNDEHHPTISTTTPCPPQDVVWPLEGAQTGETASPWDIIMDWIQQDTQQVQTSINMNTSTNMNTKFAIANSMDILSKFVKF